jgi:hypothetical protein
VHSTPSGWPVLPTILWLLAAAVVGIVLALIA